MRKVKPELEKAILDWYGEESMEDLFDNHMTEFHDSVMPGFCTDCGEYYGEVEPDAHGYECDQCGELAVSSVVEILMF